MNQEISIEKRLKGTLKGHILGEWLANSAHFPLANIFLELFLEGPTQYFFQPDLYAILFGSIVQAYVLGKWQYKGNPRPLPGNLIGPVVYTCIEVVFEGWKFFSSPYHISYWIFSVLIGGLKQISLRSSGNVSSACIILENLVRTNILLVTYWIFEDITSTASQTAWSFLSTSSHLFLTIIIQSLGFIIGFANLKASQYLDVLQRLAERLKQYSEWLLGSHLLSQALTDPTSLSLTRRNRAIVFMDIRGFTHWSEGRKPEEVVEMLNTCFELAEKTWAQRRIIKSKFTGDEIMIVIADPQDALEIALNLRTIINGYLSPYALAAGIGLHYGPLVEGILGSRDVKGYDVIGDTVNTAKRICDHAEGGELLISESIYHSLDKNVGVSTSRMLSVKGKKDQLRVYSVATH